jgi:hypothetical protein
VAEKLAAMQTKTFFRERRARADMAAFRRILDRSGGEALWEDDRIAGELRGAANPRDAGSGCGRARVRRIGRYVFVEPPLLRALAKQSMAGRARIASQGLAITAVRGGCLASVEWAGKPTIYPNDTRRRSLV